jgi:hypothetical protein
VLQRAGRLLRLLEHASVRYRRESTLMQILIRFVLLMAVIMTVLQSTRWPDGDPGDSDDSTASKSHKNEWFALQSLNTLLPLAGSILITLYSTFRPAQKFAALLVASKRIESETYRYLTRTGNYRSRQAETAGDGGSNGSGGNGNNNKGSSGNGNNKGNNNNSNTGGSNHLSVRTRFTEKCQRIYDSCAQSDFSQGSLLGFSFVTGCCGSKRNGTHNSRSNSAQKNYSTGNYSIDSQFIHGRRHKHHKKSIASSRKNMPWESDTLHLQNNHSGPHQIQGNSKPIDGAENQNVSHNAGAVNINNYVNPKSTNSGDLDTPTDSDAENNMPRARSVSMQSVQSIRSLNSDEEREAVLAAEQHANPDQPSTEVIKADDYIETRLKPKLNEFQMLLPKLTLAHKILQLLVVVITAASTAFVAFGLPSWVPVLLAASTTLEFTITYLQLETRIPSLNRASSELQKLLMWWDGLTLIKTRMPTSKDALVWLRSGH